MAACSYCNSPIDKHFEIDIEFLDNTASKFSSETHYWLCYGCALVLSNPRAYIIPVKITIKEIDRSEPEYDFEGDEMPCLYRELDDEEMVNYHRYN